MTLSVASLTAGTYPGGQGTAGGWDTSSVTAAAKSMLVLWLVDNESLDATVTGLGLTWTQVTSLGFQLGHIAVWHAVTGPRSVTGSVTISYTGGQPAAAWGLDIATGVNVTTPVVASNVLTASSGSPGPAGLTFNSPGKASNLFMFGTGAANSSTLSASPSETPPWTQLALEQVWNSPPTIVLEALETQVSPGVSNTSALANWSGDSNGWGAIGLEVNAK